MKKYLFYLLSTSLILISCKKEQPQIDESHNCDCAKEVSADFKMGEKFGDDFIELDTVAMPVDYGDGNSSSFDYSNDVYVYFSADIKNATSYEWQIGNNSITQNTKDFGLYFSDTIGTIPVRLIVHSITNKICFPNDDGIDTIIKFLTIRNVQPDPIMGKYYGYNTDNPSHYFTIEIDTSTLFYSFLSPPYRCALLLHNLPEGKLRGVPIGDDLGFTTLGFVSASDDNQPYNDTYVVYNQYSGILNESTNGIYNPTNRTIIINYYSAPVINQFQLGTGSKRKFIGKKL